MTLADAFTIYTRKVHAKTLRPFLRFAVVNAANQNHLCPVDGCVWPKGSACTMSGCPGRSLSNSARPLPRAGADAPLPVSSAPTPVFSLFHGDLYAG